MNVAAPTLYQKDVVRVKWVIEWGEYYVVEWDWVQNLI